MDSNEWYERMKAYCEETNYSCTAERYDLFEVALAEIQSLKVKLAQVTKERDAAVKDLRSVFGKCRFCRWYIPPVGPYAKCTKLNNNFKDCWEWRGVADGN